MLGFTWCVGIVVVAMVVMLAVWCDSGNIGGGRGSGWGGVGWGGYDQVFD